MPPSRAMHDRWPDLAPPSDSGDVLVIDAGGDTRSAVSGDVTTLRFSKCAAAPA